MLVRQRSRVCRIASRCFKPPGIVTNGVSLPSVISGGRDEPREDVADVVSHGFFR